jgi:2-C-methyl-D-erythritol 4-phosphate cytidylyltransferase
MKVVDSRGSVTETLDRATLRTVQYPRGFAVHELAGLLARRVTEEFDEITETLRAGVPVTVVEGDPEGFRAELPGDAEFLEAVITSRQ